ncbi:MAG: tetratricopeptide repeat protein [Bacteroidetes bacterium]|nr:MAG: tetratricopeptide repeat protein [Bacteroidota bacterium]
MKLTRKIGILFLFCIKLCLAQERDSYFLEGYEKQKVGDFRMAIELYELAMKNTGHNYYIWIAECKVELDDYSGAMIAYNNAIRDDSEQNHEAYFGRGQLKYKLQDYYGSIEDVEKAIKISNSILKTGSYYCFLGKVKITKEDFNGAIADLNRAISIPKEQPEAFKSYEEYRLFTGIHYLNEAFQYRGIAKIKLKNYEGALKDFNRCIELKPDAENYFNRGLTYIRLGNKNKACIDFSKSGELGYEKAYEAIRELCN